MFNLVFGFMLLIRFWQLGLKPVHHDESINGWFVQQLWKTGEFHYDPSNYHGPLLFYLFQIAESLGGFGVASFRFVTVLFSVLSVLWLLHWTRARFALSGWWLFGLLLSPGFLFFSRSAIHESGLVFFLLIAATAWIDAWCLRKPERSPRILYGVTGMLLLKETFVIPLALGIVVTLPFLLNREKLRSLAPQVPRLLFHGIVCLGLWAFFFSSFGANPHGLIDFFVAFLPWLKTGTQGNGHEKEFFYFLKLFWNYEPATLIALAVTVFGLFRKGWVRAVCLWSVGNFLVYSWIPYKTPWCLLSVQIPFWLSAGVTLAKSDFFGRQIVGWGLMICGIFAVTSWYDLNFRKLPKEHPYVYVQSTADAQTFAESLIRQGRERPEIRKSFVLFATEEPWPFPWWLEEYPNQTSQSFKEGWRPEVDVLVVDETAAAAAESELRDTYWKTRFDVRDARVAAVAYLRKSIFECPFPRCEEVVR